LYFIEFLTSTFFYQSYSDILNRPAPGTKFLQEGLQFLPNPSLIEPKSVIEPNLSPIAKLFPSPLQKLIPGAIQLRVQVAHMEFFTGEFQG
jgi:hypothetical protein